MIFHDIQQGTPEWHDLRLGIPTASCFGKILTPKTLKLSASSHEYMCELLAEWAVGLPLESESSTFMQRGTQLEKDAVRYYELQRDAETSNGGFCTDDTGSVGCSPDRLVGDLGGLEIKCPAPKNHIRYLLGSPMEDYNLQVQGSLWITGREWWDVMTYLPGLPASIERVYPDADTHRALDVALAGFYERLEASRALLLKRGVVAGMGIAPREPAYAG